MTRRIAVAGAAAAAVLAGVGVRALGADTAAPAPPTTSFTQDSLGVHVHIHNPNAHWGLRDQPVLVIYRNADGSILASRGPDDFFPAPGHPAGVRCCRIALLAPRADYTLDLPPVRGQVAAMSIDLRGGAQWLRM